MGNEPSLHQLQRHFSAELQAEAKPNIVALGIKSNLVAASERFSVYQNAYFARFEASLAEDFPQVQELLGTEIFSNLVKDYIIQHPSKYASLSDVSLAFPDFLRESAFILPYPFLGDLADLDWLQNLSLLSEEIKAQDFSSWATLDNHLLMQKTLKLHPSVFLLLSRWNIHELVLNKKPKIKSTYLLISRTRSNVICTAITKSDWQIFIKMQRGVIIDELVHVFSEKKCNENDLSKWFNRWVLMEVII